MIQEGQRSRRFWILGFTFLFLAHVIAIFGLGRRQPELRLWEKPRAFFYLSLDEASDRRIAEATVFRDAAGFALPHERGFSGSAWSRLQPDVPKLSNWSAPQEWLPLPVDQLGVALKDYAATNAASDGPLLAALRLVKPPEVRIPNEPLTTATTLTVAGGLAGRKLVRVPALPSAESLDVLGRTVIEISVNGDGLVETAVVAGECGSKDMDQRAVQLARALEFDPLPIRDALRRMAAAPSLGRIAFAWSLISPATTNALSAATP